MYYGLLALLTRSLRQDARQTRNHVFRLAFVAFIYLALLAATVTSGMFGAPGLRFFTQIAWLNMFFISCAGIGFFASAITEEKEEETIGLLQMAGLNPLGILLGKSTSRLIQASMLLVVQFPFALLAVTLGGVTPHQIFAAYVALLAYMILLANVALVWSTICQRGGTAAGMTTLIFVLYFAMPNLARVVSAELVSIGWGGSHWFAGRVLETLEWLGQSSIWDRLEATTQTGFNDPIFSRQVISNSLGGLVCFLTAWLLFNPFTRSMSSQGVTRGLVMKSTSRVRFLSPGRCWALPLVWKDFQFIGGGYSFAVVKLIGYSALLALIVYATTVEGVTARSIQWADVGQAYVSCMVAAVVIESCILAARVFHDEVRLQTLSSLLMLPRTIPYLAYSKALGCLMGLLPSLLCLALGALLLPGIDSDQVVRALVEPYLWGVVLSVMIFLHLIALLSLFVKWGALPLALMLMGPITSCCPVGQLLFFVVGQQGMRESYGILAATATVWILMGLVCFVFQMMIAARLQELGSK
ncbi:MAG: hypothetical protein H7062_01635 [Candidatus Saccharimonas sp.]|nr:hypothetical protein [Planctomycetaceae bacterium]